MSYGTVTGFPSQQLPMSKKTKEWRKKCVDFGDNNSFLHNHNIRKSVMNMRTNYDLLNGRVHMEDMQVILNPYGIDASFIPDRIQHYSVMNSKLKVLEGEETRRLFDYRVIVTNPNAVSEIEEEKNKEVNARLQQLVADTAQSEEEFNQELEKLSDYFTYEYQDKREVRANRILNHYQRELEFPQQFSMGFRDGYTVGEEAYQCDIVGGEPTLDKIDPMKMTVLMSGYSNKIEDADIVILEDYWSLGKIQTVFWDQLSDKDLKNLESKAYSDNDSSYFWSDHVANYNPLRSTIGVDMVAGDTFIHTPNLFDGDGPEDTLMPYDINGNIRVLRVYWKSRRKIKKVKSYDPETGEEQFDFYPETYHCNPDKGEEEQTYWVNEAWEGTKIGDDIYVNMRPRPVQYNRLSNPSRCHFGIIGSIYTTNGYEPYSLVDVMKPYAYMYDIYQDRLNKILAKNLGKIVRMDFAKVPKGWDVDKWLYYVNVNSIAVEDSYKEGDIGRSTGVLAGSMNNNSNGVIDASLGNEIQQYVNLLEWLTSKMGELAGISKQREGQVSNRETVGGVERATLQSSHSTEWLFFTHESVKKRVMECFLETAKIAFKGRKIKFKYILSDGSSEMVEIDGDEFAECDYGLVVDNSNSSQELNQKLDMLAQAGLQNGTSFSTILKIFSTDAIAEKRRAIENDEKRRMEQQQRQQQQEMQLKQMELQQLAQIEQAKREQELLISREKNETQILVAQINSQAEADRLALMNHDNDEANAIEREKIAENARQFDKKISFDKEKLKADTAVKEKQIVKSKQKNS